MTVTARAMNRRYFREAYETGVHGWAVVGPSPYAARFLERVARQIPGAALLDVGCGEGRHARLAAELGFEVTAVDYEPRAIERAQQLDAGPSGKHITFRKTDFLRARFPQAGFDVVLDYGCLHHQKKQDWPLYRNALLHALKPGGYYVLSVFSPRFRMFRGRKRRWHIAHGAYRRAFTRSDIENLFKKDFRVLAATEERGRQGGFWHVLMKRNERPTC